MQRSISALWIGLGFLAIGCSTPHGERPLTSGGSGSSAAAPHGASTADTAAAVAPRAWPHETSDIPLDPRIHFGHLDNGLRWAWAENARPEERAYLRLHVDVGSLGETESELGMAHFLEHMAFNGSEHFAPGTLIEWFQEHGMAFGADTNAHTAFSETVYKLDLPQADEETLREGLLVLRDFADGLLIDEQEVQNEKGVIDGEQRERDSAGFRMMIEQIERLAEGTRLPRRIPIGEKEVRDTFTAESVRAFYERWYRPDNMTLVLVGDLGDLDPSGLFEEFFGTMERPTTPLPAEPEMGRPTRLDHRFALYEEELPGVSLSIDRMEPYEEEAPTIAEWTEDVPLDTAHRLLGLRFRELAKQESAPFLRASVSSNELFDVVESEGLQISCRPERWEEALAFCEQELRRALEYGFQQAELDEVRADMLRGLDEAVDRQATAPSGAILREILAAAEGPAVPTDAETDRRILKPVIEALTVEDVHAALREAWGRGELALTATGNLDLGEDGDRRLTRAFEESAAVPVAAPEAIVVQDFAYASDPARAGEVVERERIEDLDFLRLKFANGVAVNVKRTDFKERQILISARFGEGLLTLDPERSVLNWVAGRVFNGGGLEAHSEDELRRLTAGKQVGVGFSVGDDSFALGGSTTAEDLLLECELIRAYLSAPGWREDGRVEMMRSIPLYFESLKHQHGGPYLTSFEPALYANDPRHRHPSLEEVEACTMDEVRDWLAPHLAEAPLEVSMVGDLDIEEAVAIAARTFGTLPARREWRSYEERRDMPAPVAGLRQEHSIDTQVPKSLVLIAFPFADGLDATTRRRGYVLNTVVNDRLRLEVRERLGAAYSPGAGLSMERVFPGVGTLTIQAMSDPEKVDTLVEACLDVAEDLATNGVQEEESKRLREPILRNLRDGKRTNGYWMNVLSEAQRRPESLDETRTVDAFYEGFEAGEISPLAERYLPRDQASILIVHPSAASIREAAAGEGAQED